MSSPLPQDSQELPVVDDSMQVDGQGEEEEGDEVEAAAPPSEDSSEEPEEDAEEERRIREGFIVDEDDDDEEDEEENSEEERRRRRKRRKRRHRKVDEDEDEGLEEDDLELLEENTGGTFARSKTKLTRLRRGRDSESPPRASSSKRKAVVMSSDDDLDADDLELPQVQDIQRIWDDERAAAGRDEDEDLDDMDNFIDYDEDEDGAGGMDEEEREERRRERRRLEKERRKALGSRPELTGIDANAWDEIHEVFGDGHDYDWALADDEDDFKEEQVKPDMNYQDVFEPSEIRARLLTEDDDLIRARDIPERMQLATSTLSQSTSLSMHQTFADEDIDEAATWVITRIDTEIEREFFRPDGQHFDRLEDLVSAVAYSLRLLFIQEFEVPYIWTHKRDYLTWFHESDIRTQVNLLNLERLWRVYYLGQKYRALLERRRALEALYTRLGVSDEHFENEIRRKIDSVEVIADTTEWLGLKYKDEKKHKKSFEMHFHDDEEEAEPDKKRKLPSRSSGYEVAKKSVISKLAEGFGIKPEEIVMNFVSSETAHFVENQDLAPEAYADQFVDPDPTKALSVAELLRRARMIIATELGKDPLLRQEMRQVFKDHARISVLPTERGVNKIDEHHPYFAFKYLYQKPVVDLRESSQFLYMLAAESEHLVTITIFLPDEAKANFSRRLEEAFASDSYTDTARAWNAERLRVINETVEQHLLPVGAKWTREWLRDEVEDLMASRCGDTLRERIDVASYKPPEAPEGIPWVLAMSWGKGDPQKDAITCVGFDDGGRLREHLKIDNLQDADPKAELLELLRKRPWNAVVIGGFSMTTTKLFSLVKEFLHSPPPETNRDPNEFQHIALMYAQDETARIFQHSNRAAEEFPSWPPIAKYCAGLARYMQSPLNEYAALGPDITSISFEEDHQQLIPREKLLFALERVLVDVTNAVGVDVNRAVNDAYYQHLLPFVCGLGPRKAQVLVKKIASLGGTLISRDQFIRAELLTTKIFLNAAGFLRIVQEHMEKPSKIRHDDDTVQDPLDDTRIHPEDYDLARKMATDALELDEEDIHGEHPSHVVSLIMQDADNVRKLDELNLDDFAVSLMESGGERKRLTLQLIREELINPFAEKRKPMPSPTPWEVLTMLSGETQRTLRVGLIVAVMVVRFPKGNIVAVRLDSGIEGVIGSHYLTDNGTERAEDVVKRGQTIPGVIIHVITDLPNNKFLVELSSRPTDVAAGDSQFRRVKHDDAWNHSQWERDKEIQARKKRAEVDKTRRVIKHPNFHNFNSSQAETYLDKQQRGDVVIRPSSKGADHLAITWKVDDRLYQHIDVVEPDADPTGQSVGTRLIIDGKYEFSDLDELIVNHVQAMARRVEELMAFEKFKAGPEDELHLFLKNFVAANPSKSAYGFALNRKRPGHFSLCFLANKNATIQTWPVRVAPEAYYLFDTPATGVPELCNAFKVRHIHESKNAGSGAGGKTAYGGRTPARTPAAALSGMTPGRMSVRQPARTPNPYAAPPPVPSRTPNPYGGAPPPSAASRTPNSYPPQSSLSVPPGMPPPYPPGAGFGMPPPQAPPYGFPGAPPAWGAPPPNVPNAFGQAPPDPHGMNPARAAMIQGAPTWGAPNGSAGW